jgi:hypothetical protein
MTSFRRSVAPRKILKNKVDTLLFLLLLVPLLFIIYPLLKPGIVVFGDFSYWQTVYDYFKKNWVWNEYGGYSSFDTLPKFPIIALFHGLGIIHIPPDILSKLIIIVIFFITSISFYLSLTLFFKDKILTVNAKLKLAVVLGSLFYAYNVWVFHRIQHWYILIGYALLPFFFVSLVNCYKKNSVSWKFIVPTIATWSIASVDPRMAIFFGLVFMGISSLFILRNFNKKQKLIQLGKPILLIIFFYLLVNSYWIYPYILSSRTGIVAPPTAITEETTQMLSRDSNFLNVFRLIQDWWCCPKITNVSPPQTSFLFPLWLAASFLLPILAFSSLILQKNNKFIFSFSLLATVGLFLVMGTQAPFNIWSAVLFHIPLVSKFNFLLREPDKFSFLIAFSYSCLISLAGYQILQRIKYKKTISCGFVILVLGSLALYSYPVYKDSLGKVYNPIILPREFDTLDNYLTSNNIHKVFFMPYTYSDPTLWSHGHLIRDDFYSFLSAVPNVRPPDYYYDFLTNYIAPGNSINNFLYPLGASHIIYHNDTLRSYTDSPDYKGLLNNLSRLKGIENIANIGFFKIFKTDNGVGQFNIPKQNVVLVSGLEKLVSLNFLDSFNSINTSLVFLDQNLKKEKYDYALNGNSLILEKNSNDLMLSFIDDIYVIKPDEMTNHHNPVKVWSKTGPTDPLHAPFHQWLKRLGIENWDSDYGKGFVITAARDKLNIPVEIQNDDDYSLYIRYMKNEWGGKIKIYLDDKLIKEIVTQDQSNKFTWQYIDKLRLTKGVHSLTLENVDGFNAVNIGAFVPPKEKNRLEDNVRSLSNKTRNIYILEAESNLYPKDSGTIVETVNDKASNTNILHLHPSAEVYTSLDILKGSNYTIALRVKTCDTCTFLRVSFGDKINEIALNSVPDLKWLYFTTYLRQGENELRIYSDSDAYLDSIMIYSNEKDHETLEDVFSPRDVPANVIDYKKIDPTKYVITINATKPYTLAFAEPYDRLWVALADNNFKAISMPLYALVNGFYVNKTGQYTLTIQYEPQNWFYEGAAVSIITVTFLAAYILFKNRRTLRSLILR